MKSLSLIIVGVVFLLSNLNAQLLNNQQKVDDPTEWQIYFSKKKAALGQTIDIVITADIKPHWHIYSGKDMESGPIVTEFNFNVNGLKLKDDIKKVGEIEKYDSTFGGKVAVMKDKAEFRQTVKIISKNPQVKVSCTYQTCNEKTGRCLPPFDKTFTLSDLKVLNGATSKKNENKNLSSHDSKQKKNEKLKSSSKESNDTSLNSKNKKSLAKEIEGDEKNTSSDTVIEKNNKGNNTKSEELVNNNSSFNLNTSGKTKSLWGFFVIAFIAGLGALLTPCVFPLIPMTVTFFLNSNQDKKAAVIKAIFYGVSIILIYTLIGSALTPLLGAEAANFISTHWLPNMIFFIIFLVFAFSFLGMFDIVVPTSLINKMDKQADKGGYLGIFFMAFTLVLVTFSCTGPIASTILVESSRGAVTKPIIGMLGYSLAFAFPFTFFAIFPSWLTSLPKSGGWLNSVKVVLGFLELAFAFKFISIADQAYHWGIIDRPIQIAIWIAIFATMGFYLLGKIRLPHDTPLEKLSVIRLIFAILTFSFVIYLVPGLFGAPLKPLSGLLPPMQTQDFNIYASYNENYSNQKLCGKPKYGNFLEMPHNLNGYFDYEQGMKCARKLNKPVFIDFTGHGCVNCRKMEENVWSDPEVLEILREDYLIISLYVDDKTTLPKEEWYKSSNDGKVKKTLGKQNADLQLRKFNYNAQPFYVLMSPEGKPLLDKAFAYNSNSEKFEDFLKKGLAKFRKQNNKKDEQVLSKK